MSPPARQLAIDLPYHPCLGRADFLVSDCNRAALDGIERWPDWPGHRLVLYGPEGSGKSHLAHLWCAMSGARYLTGAALAEAEPLLCNGAVPPGVAVDDAESAPETALLHLYNSCAEAGVGLLVVSRQAPAAWPIGLPDLASRLRAMPATGIDPPDDALLGAVLVKHFADRQLRVAPSVIAYLVLRMERSFATAAALTARLDELALAAGRKIGLPLARQALTEPCDPGKTRTEYVEC
jgi:chromosomal replication initiation ATPase DnaA